MAYYINLLTPETYEAFSNTERNVVGFRERQRALAEEIQPGDILICYVLKTAKLVGVLEVVSQTYRDDKPLFTKENDPYTVRMDVRTQSWLTLADAVPDNSDIVWNNLSFTKLIPKSSLIWTGMFRGSLRKLEDPDGKHLEWVLNDKASSVGGPDDSIEDSQEENIISKTTSEKIEEPASEEPQAETTAEVQEETTVQEPAEEPSIEEVPQIEEESIVEPEAPDSSEEPEEKESVQEEVSVEDEPSSEADEDIAEPIAEESPIQEEEVEEISFTQESEEEAESKDDELLFSESELEPEQEEVPETISADPDSAPIEEELPETVPSNEPVLEEIESELSKDLAEIEASIFEETKAEKTEEPAEEEEEEESLSLFEEAPSAPSTPPPSAPEPKKALKQKPTTEIKSPMQELKPTFDIDIPQSGTTGSSRGMSGLDSASQTKITIPINDPIRTPNLEEDLKSTAKIQAMLAAIGERMNLKIWIPMDARSRVLQHWKPQGDSLLDTLPLNLDDLTLRTVENIDLLWVRNRSIARAFEVEDPSFYHKGILRMADLLAMQSGLMIHAYIVGPANLKEAVLSQVTRPVFALMNGGSLASACSFISYDAVEELSEQKHLEYMTDVVLDEYSMHAPVV